MEVAPEGTAGGPQGPSGGPDASSPEASLCSPSPCVSSTEVAAAKEELQTNSDAGTCASINGGSSVPTSPAGSARPRSPSSPSRKAGEAAAAPAGSARPRSPSLPSRKAGEAAAARAAAAVVAAAAAVAPETAETREETGSDDSDGTEVPQEGTPGAVPPPAIARAGSMRSSSSPQRQPQQQQQQQVRCPECQVSFPPHEMNDHLFSHAIDALQQRAHRTYSSSNSCSNSSSNNSNSAGRRLGQQPQRTRSAGPGSSAAGVVMPISAPSRPTVAEAARQGTGGVHTLQRGATSGHDRAFSAFSAHPSPIASSFAAAAAAAGHRRAAPATAAAAAPQRGETHSAPASQQALPRVYEGGAPEGYRVQQQQQASHHVRYIAAAAQRGGSHSPHRSSSNSSQFVAHIAAGVFATHPAGIRGSREQQQEEAIDSWRDSRQVRECLRSPEAYMVEASPPGRAPGAPSRDRRQVVRSSEMARSNSLQLGASRGGGTRGGPHPEETEGPSSVRPLQRTYSEQLQDYPLESSPLSQLAASRAAAGTTAAAAAAGGGRHRGWIYSRSSTSTRIGPGTIVPTWAEALIEEGIVTPPRGPPQAIQRIGAPRERPPWTPIQRPRSLQELGTTTDPHHHPPHQYYAVRSSHGRHMGPLATHRGAPTGAFGMPPMTHPEYMAHHHQQQQHQEQVQQMQQLRERRLVDAFIQFLPTSKYDSERGRHLADEHRKCTICFEDYEGGDVQRRLPCTHSFHKQCIDCWLQRSTQCPICKHDLRSDIAAVAEES